MAKKRTTKRAGGEQPAAPRKARRALSTEDGKTIGLIESTAERVRASIDKRVLPELRFPTRSLQNVSYDTKKGYFELGRGRKARALSVNTVKSFAQTLRLMAMSRDLVQNDNFASKREAYYVSKNWGEARFNDQPESDTVMDDIEALASLDGLTRENLRYRADEHGGSVAGQLVVVDRDKRTGAEIRIDCTRMGSGSYTIPTSVEHLKFETRAKFILAIETKAAFDRLNEHQYWLDADCVLVGMQGVPSRSQRRFIRRLSDDKNLPVYCFVDCDPYGFGNIYRTLKVGSGNAAHINQFFCVPRAQFLGLTPQDIIDFKLEEGTHPLAPVDVKRAKDALKNDPFFKQHKAWQKALSQLMEMGVRAEQQALAVHGLNYVNEEYLPWKLANLKTFLP